MLLRNTLTGKVEDMDESLLEHSHFGQYLKKARSPKPTVEFQAQALSADSKATDKEQDN